jgi:hypothetical protein
MIFQKGERMTYDFEKLKGQLVPGKSLITIHFNTLRKNAMRDRGIYLNGSQHGLAYKPVDDIIENVTLLGEVEDQIEIVPADEIKGVEISKLTVP